MSYYVGQSYKITAHFKNAAKALTDPTVVTFTKEDEAGNQTTVLQASLTHEGTGIWSYTTSETAAGDYTWEPKGTGAVAVRDLVRVTIVPGIT